MHAIRLVLAAVLLLVGCSGGDDDTSGGTSGTTKTASLSYCCSVNHMNWSCPSQAALDKCVDLTTPDPSGCTSRATNCDGSPAK